MINDDLNQVLATRPWSLSAAFIPICITASALGLPYAFSNLQNLIRSYFFLNIGTSLVSVDFFRALVMGISIQIGANLTNTYFDFINGVDNKETPGGEKTLVDKKVSPIGVVIMSVIFYIIGLGAVFPVLMHSDFQLIIIVAVGTTLAIFYTATPVGLKYKALGDVTIFLCFGPLLMQCTSILLTGEANSKLYIYTIPLGLIIEAILHANNTRDMKSDTKAGAVTLAAILGFEGSYMFFIFLYASSYLSLLYISATSHWGCLLTLLTVPSAMTLIKHFKEMKLQSLCIEVAQMFMLFGILFMIGIRATNTGFLTFLS